MSTVTRQWLLQQQRHPSVHKWEKRWVSKGNMMIFKWVRTENRAGTGTSEEKDVEIPSEDPTLADGFLGAEGGTRRLTRGKAADMGITVESIADTNDTLLSRAAPGENTRTGEKPRRDGHTPDGTALSGGEDGSAPSPADPTADSNAAEGNGEAGKKRRRDDGAEEESAEVEAKRTRVEGSEVEEAAADPAAEQQIAEHGGEEPTAAEAASGDAMDEGVAPEADGDADPAPEAEGDGGGEEVEGQEGGEGSEEAGGAGTDDGLGGGVAEE